MYPVKCMIMNWSAKQKLLKIKALFTPLASGDSVLVGKEGA